MNMETPFVFGRIAVDKDFTDRNRETETLINNFTSLINTIIISPRRWGKSSLVNRASVSALKQDSNLRICNVDLFNVRDEFQFYSLLTQKIISATSSKWEEAVEIVKSLFLHLVPKITVGTDPSNEVSVDFDWDDVNRNPDEILDLAEKVAVKKGLKLVICIDEFQNISSFSDPDFFQKKLRSHWQLHQHVAYCLYGSKRHMMLEVFTNSSKPFYNFGSIMFLDKIDTSYLVEFISKRFIETGKTIADDASQLIVELSDNHPYYTQQLAQLSWLRTVDICTTEIVYTAHSSLVEQFSLLFVTIVETLTKSQLNFLNAFLSKDAPIYSAKSIHRYNLSSSTAIARSKKTLIEKDILDDKAGQLSFQDPIFAYWLKTVYFCK